MTDPTATRSSLKRPARFTVSRFAGTFSLANQVGMNKEDWFSFRKMKLPLLSECSTSAAFEVRPSLQRGKRHS